MKKVLLHIAIVLALFATILFSFFSFYLPWATNHDQKIPVPDLQSMNILKAKNIIKDQKLRIEISDSVFNPDMPSFSIISQYPKPGGFVKENRKIYVTLSTNRPPMIKMPKLVDASLLNATMVLQTYGLKLGNVTKVPHYADNVVLKQYYNGREIKDGASIGKGSSIDLMVSDGKSNEPVALPNLVGLDREEAILQLQNNQLGVGSENYDENSNKPEGTIVRQKPEFKEGETINKGQNIDIWISGKRPENYVNTDDEVK